MGVMEEDRDLVSNGDRVSGWMVRRFSRRMVVMVVQPCEYTQCQWTVWLKLVKTTRFIKALIFYYNLIIQYIFKDEVKKKSTRTHGLMRPQSSHLLIRTSGQSS